MWVSKRKIETMDKRIAELEQKLQVQQKAISNHLDSHTDEIGEVSRVLDETKKNFIDLLGPLKEETFQYVLSRLNRQSKR